MADQPQGQNLEQLAEAAAELRKKLAEAGKAKRQALASMQASLADLRDAGVAGAVWTTNEVRVLEKAMRDLTTIVQTQDMFCEQLALDQFQLAQEFQNLNQSGFMTAAMVETIMLLLKEKGFTTDEELKSRWDKVLGTATQPIVPVAAPAAQVSDTPLTDLLAQG